MSEIVEIEEFFYFNVEVKLQFLFFKEMQKSKSISVNVVIEKKETNCFNLADIENAKNKAIILFGEMFDGTEMEDFIKQADRTLPVVTAVTFLGSSTHDDFIGNVANKENTTNANQ